MGYNPRAAMVALLVDVAGDSQLMSAKGAGRV